MITYNGPERYEVLNNILRLNNILVLNTGAEIGVRNGETSDFLLHNNPKLDLILVDPYSSYNDLGYVFEEKEQASLKKATRLKLNRFNHRHQWIYKPSVEASKQVKDGSLDVVFIDAIHEEPYVSQDLMAWYPKIRHGGILAGHDYQMTDVKKAVNTWAATFGKLVVYSDTNSDIWAIEL